MSWDSRQRAMLAEMGLRLPASAAEVLAEPAPAPEPVAAAPVVAPPSSLAPVPVRPPAAPVPGPAAVTAPQSAVRVALAGLDLDALRAAVLDGRACGACEHRSHLFGRGALPRADWLVVTDAPTEADEAAGQLFVAEPGRLLDRMLLAAGQRLAGDAPSAFVAPLVPGRAPRGRPPQPHELDAGEAQLARLAELLQPRLVLAIGPLAARRLTGLPDPLGRLRGRVHAWRGLPLVVTYAPSYLLRSPADKSGAWDDLRLALASRPA
ncbi:uracil-DNA glycosylase [Roseateles sp. LKC17W]|uniref:Uracil-DNA glycosylase n=1 Tax=Pelomonas margarita TaxID=3299031 RepID=A0ABW7FNH9_9BURK